MTTMNELEKQHRAAVLHRKFTFVEYKWQSYHDIDYRISGDRDLVRGEIWSKTDQGYFVTHFDANYGPDDDKRDILAHDLIPYSEHLRQVEIALADWARATLKLRDLHISPWFDDKHVHIWSDNITKPNLWIARCAPHKRDYIAEHIASRQYFVLPP